jgi:hypothetical protein
MPASTPNILIWVPGSRISDGATSHALGGSARVLSDLSSY